MLSNKNGGNKSWGKRKEKPKKNQYRRKALSLIMWQTYLNLSLVLSAPWPAVLLLLLSILPLGTLLLLLQFRLSPSLPLPSLLSWNLSWLSLSFSWHWNWNWYWNRRSGDIAIRNPFPTDTFTIPTETSNVKKALGWEVDITVGATRAHIDDLDEDLGSRGACFCTVD